MADDIKLVIGVEDRDLIRAQKEQVKFQRNIITIEKAFRAGDITAKRYNQELAKQAKELQKLGGSYNKANSEIRKFAYQLRGADDASLSAAESYAFAGKKVNRLGVGLQQAGYQVGDFAVQIQGGTNAMVALGQQGSQLLGIFGAGGAIAGAGLAIATAFLAPLFRAQEEAKNLEESLEDLGSSAEKLSRIRFNSLGDSLVGPIKEAKEEFQSLLNLMEAQELKALKDKLEAPFRAVVAELTAFQKLSDVRARLGGPTPDFDSELGLSSRNEALFLATQLKRLEGETSEELASQLDSITEALELRGILTEEVQSILVKMAEEIGLLEIIEEKTEAAAENVKKQNESHTEAESRLSRISLIMSQIRSETEEAAVAASDFAIKLAEIAAMGPEQSLFEAKVSSGIIPPQAAGDFGVSGGETPFELQQYIDAVNRRVKAREEAAKTSGGGGQTNAEYLEQQLLEINQRKTLIGLSQEEISIQKIYNEAQKRGISLSDSRVKELVKEQKELNRLSRESKDYQEMIGGIRDNLTNAFTSILNGTKSVKDAFKDMIRQMIMSMAQKNLVQPLVSGMTGGGGGGSIGQLASTASAAGGLSAALAAGGSLVGVTGLAGGFGAGAGMAASAFAGGGMSALAGTIGAQAAAATTAGASMAAMGAAIGAVAAPLLAVAAVFTFFKKKTKELDSGLKATVDGFDSAVESFKVIQTKKFFGLSKKVRTQLETLPDDNPLGNLISVTQQSIVSSARYLGAATDAFSDFSYEFELSLKGLSEEARTQKITEEINKLGNAFASLIPNIGSVDELNSVLQQRLQLEEQLLTLQGNTEELRRRELESVHELNRGILEQIYAAEDAKTAMDKFNNSLKETNFATLLSFQQARAAIGSPVANELMAPTGTGSTASSVISSGTTSTTNEVKQMVVEMKAMHKETMFAFSKMIKNGKDSRDTLRSWDVVGLPAERTA